MADYEFVCKQCPKAPVGADAHFVKSYPMAEAPDLGAKIKCPVCSKKTAARILSSGVTGIVKGKAELDWKPGNDIRTRINGQEINFQFVDHPHTDPAYQRNLAALAARNNLTGDATQVGKARYDEKHGRMVVDVASNVPDPLGKIERAKKSGEYRQTTTNVNQKYRVRPKKKK